MKGTQLKRTVEHLFDVIPGRSAGDELVFICPNPSCPDQTGNRSVNLKTGLTGCWRCNTGGLFIPWARSLGHDVDTTGMDDPSAESLQELLDEIRKGENVGRISVLSTWAKCDLPSDVRRCEEYQNSWHSRKIEQMMIGKNLDWQAVLDADVHFTREDGRWEPYAIFPVKEWNEIVYFQGRKYDPEPGDKKTKLFPPRATHPMGSKYWVYGIDEIRAKPPKTLIVVESILNVLSLRWELTEQGLDDVDVVCVFKHNVSPFQIAKICSISGIEEINFMYDADSTASSWANAEKFSNTRKVSVTEIDPHMGPTTDANDDARHAVLKFRQRKEFSAASSLSNLFS